MNQCRDDIRRESLRETAVSREVAYVADTRPVGSRGTTSRPKVGSLIRVLLGLVRSLGDLALDYLYDFWRYFRFSGTFGRSLTRTRLKTSIILNYHAIEKGLSLREPRLGFGASRIRTLVKDVRDYINRFGSDETVQVAISVLEVYHDFHKTQGQVFDELDKALESLRRSNEEISSVHAPGGVVHVSAAEITSAARGNFAQLVHSRHSIRRFSSRKVDLRLVQEAIKLAIQSPSVCNRPSWKVRAYSGRAKDRVLELQHGNRGFGHEASWVLIVTGDLEYFRGNRERNQVFIDGGLFAMTLLYSLHYFGLGACALNLCIDRRVDRELRKVAGIAPTEAFIMMIAVGHMDDVMTVTRSHKPHLNDVLVEVCDEKTTRGGTETGTPGFNGR